jgi:pantothenate kinase
MRWPSYGLEKRAMNGRLRVAILETGASSFRTDWDDSYLAKASDIALIEIRSSLRQRLRSRLVQRRLEEQPEQRSFAHRSANLLHHQKRSDQQANEQYQAEEAI